MKKYLYRGYCFINNEMLKPDWDSNGLEIHKDNSRTNNPLLFLNRLWREADKIHIFENCNNELLFYTYNQLLRTHTPANDDIIAEYLLSEI